MCIFGGFCGLGAIKKSKMATISWRNSRVIWRHRHPIVDLKESIFGPTIYPPSLIVLTYMLAPPPPLLLVPQKTKKKRKKSV